MGEACAADAYSIRRECNHINCYSVWRKQYLLLFDVSFGPYVRIRHKNSFGSVLFKKNLSLFFVRALKNTLMHVAILYIYIIQI